MQTDCSERGHSLQLAPLLPCKSRLYHECGPVHEGHDGLASSSPSFSTSLAMRNEYFQAIFERRDCGMPARTVVSGRRRGLGGVMLSRLVAVLHAQHLVRVRLQACKSRRVSSSSACPGSRAGSGHAGTSPGTPSKGSTASLDKHRATANIFGKDPPSLISCQTSRQGCWAAVRNAPTTFVSLATLREDSNSSLQLVNFTMTMIN
jgi:hypothetical protein